MKILGTLLLCVALMGCVSSHSITAADGTSFQVKDRAYKDVYNAAILTVASIGEITAQNRQKGEVRGLKGVTEFSAGEALGVFINPPKESVRNFTVTVVSKHVVTTQLTGTDFTSTMIAAMKARLDM